MPDKLPLDLGRKVPHPSILNAIPDKMKEEEPVEYPKLYLQWDKSYGLPEGGSMVVEFKKASEVTTDEDGKISQSVTLDITKIVSVEADKSVRDETRGDRLDKLRREVEDMKEEEGDYEE